MNIGLITVMTRELEKSVQFYQTVLEFEKTRQFSPRPGMKIVFLKDKNGSQIEFIFDPEAKPFQGEGISIGFYTDNILETEKHLKNHQVEIISGPITTPNGV
ncbi:MAG: hypothetical protein A2Y41_04865, partial [Spirochaetes bacterium GWB1_36_13]